MPEILVQVREGRDLFEARVVVNQQREPQPQLGEPHRHGVQVDSEQVVADDGAPPLGGRLAWAQPLARLLELRQHLEQERSGSHGGVEHPDPREGVRVPARQRGRERSAHDVAEQGARREVSAAVPSLRPRHEALEHAAQHFRIHRVRAVALAHREVESLEQLVEQGAPGLVVERRPGKAALDGVALEQPAVEERQLTEGPGGACAPVAGRVEGAEAEGLEHRAVKGVAATERCVEKRR